MFCPHTIIAANKWLYIKRQDSADYYTGVPLKIKLNPLRYEIVIRYKWKNLITINNEGRLHIKFSNFLFRLGLLK